MTFLQAQNAQRRAALTRRIEGRGHDIAHGLLGKRRGVHDHRILAAGLRDEGDVAASRSQRVLNVPRNCG